MTGIMGIGYGTSAYAGYTGYSSANVQAGKPVVNPGESTVVTPGRKSSPAECETCKNRKYQDGSDEMVLLNLLLIFLLRPPHQESVLTSRSM